MKLYKLAALFLLGSVSLWAQNATKPATTDQKTPAPAAKAHHDHKAMHKGCPCGHAADPAKKECHCKEMMEDKDAQGAEMCEHGKAENMSKAKPKEEKDMAKAGCCGCCGGKCDRMKHKMEHDKATSPKPGV